MDFLPLRISLFTPKFPLCAQWRPSRSPGNFELKTPGAKFCLDFDLVGQPTWHTRVVCIRTYVCVYTCIAAARSFVRINASARAEKRVSASRETDNAAFTPENRPARRLSALGSRRDICISSRRQAVPVSRNFPATTLRQTLLSKFRTIFVLIQAYQPGIISSGDRVFPYRSCIRFSLSLSLFFIFWRAFRGTSSPDTAYRVLIKRQIK